MPVIRVDFDNQKVTDKDVTALCEAVQKIVCEATGIEDVFVYANSAHIHVKIAPIEVFVEMSAHKIQDVDTLLRTITKGISQWKAANHFPHLVNLTLYPKQWKIELGI